MCKSRAEGGARCNAHIKQAVNQQMASYAAAVSPVTGAQANQVFADLVAEGEAANLPDPSREEVDQWLNQTIAQVRFEPSITESRRERIIRRLREALGRAVPNGATFHAWKNIMAEAWQRSRRKAAVFFVAGVITFSGGCGMSPGNAEHDDPSPTSTVQVVDGYPEFSKSATKPQVPSDVEAKFGAKDALEAYEMGSQVILKNQMDGALLGTPIDKATKADFADVRSHLSPARQKDLDAKVAAMGSDENAYAAVVGISGVGVGQGDIQIKDPSTGKMFKGDLRHDVKTPAYNRSITSPKMSVSDDGRLRADFKSSADLRVSSHGKNYITPLSNTTTLWFTKVNGKWKIDGWNAAWKSSSDVAVDKH